MSAKHLQIALSEGVEAGMDAYMRAPISQQYPLYAEITKKRTPATKLDAYCKAFGLTNDANGVIRERTTSDLQAAIEAGIAAALQSVGVSAPQPARKAAPTKGAKTKGTKRTPRTKIDGITNDEAWVALGSDPTFKSENRGGELATNGQLYRLNALGLLALRS